MERQCHIPGRRGAPGRTLYIAARILVMTWVSTFWIVPASHADSAWAHLTQAGQSRPEDFSAFERQILQALTTEQADAYAAGANPQDLLLASGETLDDLMARILGKGMGEMGLVYYPLPTCVLVRTVDSVAGPLQPDGVRNLVARGETLDLSAQGGSPTGCGIPLAAKALLANFIVVAPSASGELKVWPSDQPPGGSSLIRFNRSLDGIQFDNAAPVALCTDIDCPSEFRVQSRFAITHLRIDVMGYFAPDTGRNALDAADGDPQAAVFVDDLGRVGIGTTTPDQALDVLGGIRFGTTSLDLAGTIRWNGTDFEGFTTQWESLTTADWSTISGKPSTFPPSGSRVGNFTIDGDLDVFDDLDIDGNTNLDGDLRIGVNGSGDPRLFLGNLGLITMQSFYQDSARIEIKGYDNGSARTGIELMAEDKGGELTLFDGNLPAVPNTINQTVFLDGRVGSRGGKIAVRDGARSEEVIQLLGYDTSDNLDVAMIRVLGGVKVEKDGGGGGFLEADQVILEDYLQLALTSGSPPSSDCNSASEWGRMKVDAGAGVIYVCVASGWVTR